MVKIFIGVIIAAFVVIVGFMLIDPTVNTAHIDETVEVSTTTSRYTIEGEVYKTGSYTLSDAISMADLINAAGGLTNNADERAFFENAVLEVGETYYIASRYDVSDICNNTEITKVNINADDADTLMTINGITTSIASSIVSYRIENGQFNTIEDLMDVYGIGNATYRKIRSYVILHEWFYLHF